VDSPTLNVPLRGGEQPGDAPAERHIARMGRNPGPRVRREFAERDPERTTASAGPGSVEVC
jgi:hypothetical protein